MIHGFKKIREQDIPELGAHATIYRHEKTGARVLSMQNSDENKVFGISFRTPPKDSTGVAHILEHSVLCGSEKYPVKEPFVELLKGSLQTFLNAMTFPDKTCYPVASANLADFYNLVDVYLDAVFFPLLDPNKLKQEGWHFELEGKDKPLTCKGVVYNEMKGAYSSPDSLLYEHVQQSLFPDNTYGLDSGGDPEVIPQLTWEKFSEFHSTHYHPSNAYAYFYGDDEPEKRLEILDAYFSRFEQIETEFSRVPLQERFAEAIAVKKKYPASQRLSKGMFTVNWMLAETADANLNLALHILEHILIGMPSSPLRKALTDSGMGEDIAGVGLEADIRQMFFSVGLKGIHPANAIKIESIVFNTVKKLIDEGIDPKDVEAAINTVEFDLRENNTGSYPRGLALMFQALSTWIYEDENGNDGDPLMLLAFEEPLRNIKTWVERGDRIFEELLARLFMHNPHRTTVTLEPDQKLSDEIEKRERTWLAESKQAMNDEQLEAVMKEAEELRILQETPDSPEALASIPRLGVDDLPRENKIIPLEEVDLGAPCLFHDLPTNSIAYVDLGFDLTGLPEELVPYVPLFGRALVECGTEQHDFVSLSQWIARTTGGISPQVFISPLRENLGISQHLFLRGKSTVENAAELFAIFREILSGAKLDDRVRMRQIINESKARVEQRLVPAGHQMVARRLKATTHPAHAMEERMSGIEQLEFLRTLSERVENDFRRVAKEFEAVRKHVLNRAGLLVNATMDADGFKVVSPMIGELAAALPEGAAAEAAPRTIPELVSREGLAIPAQVNYVGKGCNVYEHGFEYHGSIHAVSRFLRTGYLWDKIRVQGGAYGSFSVFDRSSGALAFVSYRDPNVEATIANYDGIAEHLENIELDGDALEKSIIGAIGEMDSYQLPDAQGFTSMARWLTGDDAEHLQAIREDVLGTTQEDFRRIGKAARIVAEHGSVVVLGNEPAMTVSGLDLEIKQAL